MELAERLAGTSPDEDDMGPSFPAAIFACHDSNEGDEIICAGWAASVGASNPNLRLLVNQGSVSSGALARKADWPKLHRSFVDVIAKLRRHEIERLRKVMAAALERVEVDDCGEAEAILSAEVALDGSPVR